MTERQRILLAEFEPAVPGDPVYATWSPSDKHADIALSGGNLTATKSTQHATNWACVRATNKMLVGQRYWETQVNFTGAGDFSVGLARASKPLDIDPGGNLIGGAAIAVRKDGAVKVGGGSGLGFLGAIPSGTVIRHWLDLDVMVYRLAAAGGSWLDFDVAPLFGDLANAAPYPIVGFLRPIGATCSAAADYGATPFAYPVPAGARAGVYTLPAPTRRTIYLSNTGFKTDAKVAPASTYYDARLAGDSDVEFTREISLSAWDGSATARGGEVSVINRDGGIDEWLAWEWRDAPFRLYSGYEGDARDAFTLWSSGVCDRIEGIDNRRMRIVLASPLSRLDVPVQNTLWPDDADNAALRGKPLPLVIGRPRWCEPQRINTAPAVRDYRVHDGIHVPNYGEAIDSISQAYDGGDLFAGPDDPYTANSTVTAANGGNFGSWSGTPPRPSGWSETTAFGATNDRFTDSGLGQMRCQSGGALPVWMKHSVTVPVGRHVITFNVGTLTTAGTLYFSVGAKAVACSITSTGAKTVTIDVPESGHRLTVGMGPILGLPGTQLDCTINTLRMSSQQIIDWTDYNDSGNLVGLTLANQPESKVTCHPVGPKFAAPGGLVVERASALLQYLRARAQVDRAIGFSWDATSSPAALEAAAAARLATYLTAPVTYAALLRQFMDALLAGAWVTRSGALAVQRWAEPDPGAVVLTLNDTNVAGDVVITLDQAKNLRRRVAGRYNHAVHADGDIATSVSPDLRAELTSKWGSIANGANAAEAGYELPLSAAYQAAEDRDALETLLQEDADIQQLANSLCTLWRSTRYFYDLSAVLDADAADALEPGQTVRLVWSRIAGLAGGIPLRVVRARTRFFSRRVDLRLWGSAPPKMA